MAQRQAAASMSQPRIILFPERNAKITRYGISHNEENLNATADQVPKLPTAGK
jgi:hypothetical protein